MPSPPRSLKRVHYFHGQLLTVADFTTDQEYFLNRWRRHNQWCHGWGVVEGLDLAVRGREVIVAPGMALDCQGDEVILPSPARVRLPAHPPSPTTRYVVLSALEELTDPVPALVGAASSDSPETAVMYTRIVEGSRLALTVQDPAEGHTRHKGRCKACGRSHGVTLGRLQWRGGRWRIDARYRRCQACI